jgi:hypothetical protein
MRLPDWFRANKARRGWLRSQDENAKRLAAPEPRPAWKDRRPMVGLPGTLACRRRAAKERKS